MAYKLPLLGLASMASAFPSLINERSLEVDAQMKKLLKTSPVEKRQVPGPNDPLGISQAQTNCGFFGPCTTFDDASQLVSTTGDNAFISPGPGDIRGPCPGLNAAANHGYLPRNGILTIEQTADGLFAAYGLEENFSRLLAVYSIAVDGNVGTQQWSIGGPLPADLLDGPLLGNGQGISYSHNNYEGDTSIGRNDAYVNNGDAHSLNVSRFQAAFDSGADDDRYTMDKFRQVFEANQDKSIAENPYYFTAAFSTFLVAPAAYNFVINFMSNHTAEEPSGYLDGDVFKQFFAVTGDSGAFVWNPGQERIPDNWYKRPVDYPYDTAGTVGDVIVGYQAYPNSLKFGGNLGTTNSFTGIDLANATGGVFDLSTLFEGDNFACFSELLLQMALPDALNNVLGALAPATDLVNNALATVTTGLDCPQLDAFDQTLFNQFPGRQYSPTGPDTNY